MARFLRHPCLLTILRGKESHNFHGMPYTLERWPGGQSKCIHLRRAAIASTSQHCSKEKKAPAKRGRPKKSQSEPQAEEKEQKKASKKSESKADVEEKPKAEKRKKADSEKEGGSKKSKAADKAPAHGKEQIENPVEAITDPSEVPKGAKRDDRGRLVFEGFDNFHPTLTPKQVIQAGSFGGIYFNPMGGRKSTKYPKGPDISADEFPKDWFEGLEDKRYKGTRYNVELNKYGVKSGQNQSQWEEQGWIKDQDQRGWFQWYCRFVQGRRTEDDERQISRWVGVAGPKGRWKTRLVNLVKDKGGVDSVQDASISPVIRQNLLHWAYELTPQDFKAMAEE